MIELVRIIMQKQILEMINVSMILQHIQIEIQIIYIQIKHHVLQWKDIVQLKIINQIYIKLHMIRTCIINHVLLNHILKKYHMFIAKHKLFKLLAITLCIYPIRY